MFRAGLVWSLLLLVFLLGATLSWAAAPRIVSVDITRREGTWPGYDTLAHAWMEDVTVVVEDTDGVADFADMTLTAPDGSVLVGTPRLSQPFLWTPLSDTQMSVSWQGDWSDAALPAGVFTVTVQDQSLAEDTLTTVSVPEATGLLPTLVAPEPMFSKVAGTDVTFQWSGGPPEAATSIWVYSVAIGTLWQQACGSAQSLAYNADDTALEPLLAGHAYGWEVTSRVTVTSPDPRVTITREGYANGEFIIASPGPVLESVQFHITSAADGQGPQYTRHECVAYICVTNSAGVEEIASMALIGPDGLAYDFCFCPRGGFTLYAFPLSFSLPPSVTQASYTVLVTDQAGHTTSLSTSPVGPLSILEPASPAQGAVIAELMPTFSWGGDFPANAVLALQEEGYSGGFVWGTGPISDAQVAYNSDGLATESALQPGHTYVWTLGGTAITDLGDRRMRVVQSRTSTSIFTEYEDLPARPDLRGKLAYSLALNPWWDGTWLVAGYHPDPDTRTWYGPVGATAPVWSPDGSKLMYLQNYQIYVDALDGTPPTALPIPEVADYPWVLDCKWAPDGEHIVFTVVDYYNGYPQSVWVSKADGSEATPLASDPSLYQRFPDWSPDGNWIAYRRFPLGDAHGVWIASPDGSNAHPLLATTLDGYAGVTVDFLDQPSWSPDGRRLAVLFGGKTSEGGDIGGIGTISREGGPVLPLFITPDDYACCASAKMPLWSPDGQSVLFVSAHHLPVNGDWQNGAFEPGVEVWSVNANGAGEPVRLTYDYGYNTNLTWFMKKAFLDVAETYWAYDAIKACREAGLVRGYEDGTFQPELLITRDQLAVYLARALAGGEANVPYPTTKASFRDVPTDQWAFKYVEYCKAHNVITLGNGSYHPEVEVTRGQMAIYMARAIAPESDRPSLTGYTPPETPSFPDVPVSDARYRYIEYLHAHGVVNGYEDGTYHQELKVSRAQLAVFVARGFGVGEE